MINRATPPVVLQISKGQKDEKIGQKDEKIFHDCDGSSKITVML